MKNIVKAYELEHSYYNKCLFRWIDEDERTCFSDSFAGFQNEGEFQVIVLYRGPIS